MGTKVSIFLTRVEYIITEAILAVISKSPLVITRDAISYYEYVIQTLIHPAGVDSVYRKNRNKLRKPSKNGRPSHALELDLSIDPPVLNIRPLRTWNPKDNRVYKLETGIELMDTYPRGNRECVLACAKFYSGEHSMIAFTLGEVDKI
jgi:hypothetical protein